ncbi:hypothetical protein [Aromatoleum aromaticum]|uniref:hypothetical protein n=1 Tax=Aromatoleum aromaticum TaxID=551760 RepID=UPI00031D6F5B|nr:hypothetical protein [Aromatoleum aromaticum]
MSATVLPFFESSSRGDKAKSSEFGFPLLSAITALIGRGAQGSTPSRSFTMPVAPKAPDHPVKLIT